MKDSTNDRVFSSDEDDSSLCKNLNVLNKYITSVGFGNAVDPQGRGYSVRLFSTAQKGDVEPRRRILVPSIPRRWS